MSSQTWGWARSVAGAAILGVLVWRVGAGPFVDAVPMIDARSMATVTAVSLLTTVCCAWRWSLVARGLGVGVPLPSAVAACYRSQFLNTTLPGGVAGDVHRAWRHGRDAGDVSRGIRAVAWERLAGQVVLVAVAAVALLVLPSPVRSSMPVLVAAVGAVTLVGVLLARSLARTVPDPRLRVVRTAHADLRVALLSRRAWPGVAVSSALAVAGHVVTFVIAARVAGSEASLPRLIPLALLALLAMGLPVNVAGWGPREGMAAWTFGLAGLGVAQGVATAVVYGVMVFVASLPGAVVLLLAWWLRRRASGPSPLRAQRSELAIPEIAKEPVHV